MLRLGGRGWEDDGWVKRILDLGVLAATARLMAMVGRLLNRAAFAEVAVV
jgi:hypothetical protein